MFDFLDSDWFNITLEIIFLILISYDIKKYIETKKKEYITNIVLTLGFAVWTLHPYYNSYLEWDDGQKLQVASTSHHDTNQTVNACVDEKIFKEYSFENYQNLDKNATDFKEFVEDAREDCSDDSWF